MTSDTAVITGSSGALGSEVARHLVSKGYRVALIDTPRSAERLRELATSLGSDAHAIEANITQPSAWPSVISSIEARFGPPTHAVLVAGGWHGGTPLHAETDDGVWRAMLDSNLETAYAALRGLLAGMVARKKGSVVVIGSQVAERPWSGANSAAYTAAKSAVVALAQATAQEVLEHGVRINTLLPSTMDTPANRRAMPKADPSRWVTPASVSEVIAFLLSDAARDVSGAAIPVYGKAT